jgi:ribosomal protein L37AE/L43A
MADDVLACPECDAAQLNPLVGDDGWRCSRCSAHIEEPRRRASKHIGGGVRRGMAARLDDADPEEVAR